MKLIEIHDSDRLLHEEAMNLWEMANLRPDFTNLPVVIWVSSGEAAQHGPRIKVCKGPKWNSETCSTVPLTGKPRILGNAEISQDDFSKIVKWVEINKPALLKFWNGEIQYTQDLEKLLKPYSE